MNFEELVCCVEEWANTRGLLFPDNARTQLLYANSEMGELADGELKNDKNAIEDAVGDTLVCLINYCACRNLNIVSCLEQAYNVISQRTGKTIDGAFVKDNV